MLDHGVHIVGEREVVDVKCNDAQIVLIVNKDKASDRFKHKHAHVLSVSIFDLLFFSVLIRYCFVKPRHSHYHDMGSIGGSVPVIA